MKKLIGTAMLAALLATSAFAELSVGVWLRQVWSPVAYNGGDVKTTIQNPWGVGRTGSVGLNWVGDDEKAGMSFSFVSNMFGGAFVEADGNNLFWVKPWDWLKVSFGHWDGINDISTVNTASWNWNRPGTWVADNLYTENESTGVLIEVFPVDNLVIRAGLPFLADNAYDYKNAILSYHMFEALTADLEYTIEDVLGIKVGWRGGRYNDYHRGNFAIGDFKSGSDFMNVGEVDVFLSLLAVENLQLDLGAKINILNADYGKVTYKAKGDETDYAYAEALGRQSALIGLKAGYNITDNFSIKADFAVVTYKDFKYNGLKGEHKPDFAFGVGVGVGLTDSLSLDADFRCLIKGDAKNDGGTIDGGDPTFSFLVGLNYACSSNASVGIGFQGKTNGGEFGDILPKNGDNFGFTVPITVELSF